MLANRTASQSSTFIIPNQDDCGAKIDAVSASWELFDARGNSIATAAITPFDTNDADIEFTIDGANLTLQAAGLLDFVPKKPFGCNLVTEVPVKGRMKAIPLRYLALAILMFIASITTFVLASA